MNYKEITYPSGFVKSLSIGVTAPSSGLGRETFIKRYELVAKQLSEKGYKITEGKCLRENHKHISASAEKRAEDFHKLWFDSHVDLIFPPWGGELLIEILDKIDYTKLLQNPKWLLGYSDTSTLLFAITVKTGVATAHGMNLMDSVNEQNDSLSSQALEYLKSEKGDQFSQYSSEKYQEKFIDYSDDLEASYNLTEPTKWKTLGEEREISLSGRLIGGCIDVIGRLVGTPYGNLQQFKDSFADDGVILYLENCEQSPCEMTRALHQMRLAGWFDDLNGVIFGRTYAKAVDSPESLNHTEALKNCFKDFDFPVIYDADIGHKPPNMTLINGALAELSFKEGKAKLIQKMI